MKNQMQFADWSLHRSVPTTAAAMVAIVALLCSAGTGAQTTAHADTQQGAAAPAATDSATATAPDLAPVVVAAAPRYSTEDTARVFGFIDANRNGQISRDEASRAKNVAKHFDAADANHDGALSIDEFRAALNQAKP